MTYADSLLSEFVFIRFKSSSGSFSLLQLVCASVNTEMALGCGPEPPHQDALEDMLSVRSQMNSRVLSLLCESDPNQ